MRRFLGTCVVICFFVTAQAGFVVGDTITLKSDANTLAAATATNLDTGDITGLTFSPVDVGAFGSGTPIPTGAPEGTLVVNIPPHNGQSGFFKTTFILPDSFSDIQLAGAASADDTGYVFLNGTKISGALSLYEGVAFSTDLQSLFVAGENVFVVSDNNSGGGPSGSAFYATITYTPTPEPGSLILLATGLFGAIGLFAWRRRRQAA